MKTRLVSLTFRGSASVDPRYSASMLPWTINDIRSTESYTKLSVGIEHGILESYNSDFELQFSHPLKHIVGMCRIIHKPQAKSIGNGFLQLKSSGGQASSSSAGASSMAGGASSSLTGNGLRHTLTASTSYGSLSSSAACAYQLQLQQSAEASAEQPQNFMEFQGPITGLVYLLKDPKDPLLHIYLFECEAVEEMAELMHQMRDPAHTLGGSVGSIPQTLIGGGGGSHGNSNGALNGIHATPATNLKMSEAMRNAQHDTSPNPVSSKMKASKSYTHGLSSSSGTVNIPTSTSAQSNLSLLADISPNHTHFFEVMYVGKIRVSQKRVPNTFIDDALPKFKAYDAQRLRLLQNRKMSLSSEGGVGIEAKLSSSLKSHDLKEEDEEEQEQHKGQDDSQHSQAKPLVQLQLTGAEEGAAPRPLEDNKENKSPEKRPLLRGQSQIELGHKEHSDGSQPSAANSQLEAPNVIVNKQPTPPRDQGVGTGTASASAGPSQLHPNYAMDNIPKQRDRSASQGCIPPYVEQNRTMVFLVGRCDLRLISPDRKQVLLYKDFKDVASCVHGQKSLDHFGIICRELNNDGYIGYVFKCQSEHVCDDIVAAIAQAFDTCAEQKKKQDTQIFSCEHCPMLWYHKLCTDVEGLSEKKTQALILRRIETLSDDEQEIVWAKFCGSEKTNSPVAEQNQFLMMLLRAHCESRQQRHVHDTAENRSEFLNQYLGGSTIFMKAKRSLTNSFDNLLKRKPSKDDIAVPSHNLRDIREGSAEPLGTQSPPEGFRSRSNTVGASPSSKPTAEQLKSPMMDIFIKVGNSPKEAETHQGSWRQAILNSVVTPSKGLDSEVPTEFLSPMRKPVKRGKRNADELRELWRTAIRQTIMLNRMETENAMLQARQNENELKRIKLDYEEIVPCDKQLIERWEQIIERNSTQIGNKKDPKVLGHAIRTGVPRSKRGDVWTFLAEQHSMNTAPVDTKRFPNFNTPYHTLLKHLTEHQHAIFIDLGRTFPNHQFYKDPLGLGQLSLFNLLKAYSILDPELGYCQGLGFICGVLLLHCDEANAFQLLKHLMFRRNMRTKYLPDMKKFQLQLYQLSRLVKDHLPDLYVWLDQNDVSPTLYAAPWILTVFSSQFPLGFVARVFDLLFLESSDVIFKFAIALLSVHKQQLLAKDNFEEIMDYLKTVVPKMEHTCMEQIMKLVFSMDIGKQLAEYNVEYNVLQEEITTTNHHLEMLNREKTQNQHLEQQLQFAQSSIAQLETTRSSQQAQITTLQSQVQSLELTIQTLGRYVGQLVEHNPDLELPNEVRRMLQQLDDLDRQRRKPIFTERKIGKSVSVNSHLGFPLKVLEELTERDELGSPQKQKKEKTPFFEQLRQQQQQHRLNGGGQSSNVGESVSPTPPSRPNRLLDNASARTVMQVKLDELKLPEHVDKFVANIKSPLEVDSGVGTPLSPPSTASNSSGGSIFSRMGYRTTPPALSPLAQRQSYGVANTTAPSPQHMEEVAPATTMAVMPRDDVEEPQPMHPLSMVGGDVNVRFKGTTQLKSIRPVHHMRAIPLGGVQHPSSTEPAVRVAPVPVELAPPAATATTGRS
ncbi:TBC1 domain family member 4 isoform X1 [Drosophila mauritiana]|uniref:TBC1 domain family member 4 isoform X1 n=1 Tax=Drosophila mauritiana TaxID=7226 RepID=A0A6P8JZF9_DROMA|nr:TBC1 domain family member 4 isoform X1 [Drosophila mauritiana]XP_033162392.1 TBC1 domain family member 4 isoform X1 [Drosophila mauritiana]XP_033162393.1 TBC1 domain family member 4 isoform X1 [Drosophila mauritiana]